MAGVLRRPRRDGKPLSTSPRLVTSCGGHMNLRRFTPPVELPTVTVMKIWHERHHHDAEHRWFRELLSELFH